MSRWQPYPAYKDSGVEWLGQIPAHWDVKRLMYACVLNPKKSESNGLAKDTAVTFLPMEAIGDDGTIKHDETRHIEDVAQGYTYFRDGDVVVAKITPCFENGKGALCHSLEGGIGFGTTELHVLRARSDTDAKFVFYLTRSHLFRKTGEGHMQGAAGQKRVPENFVRGFVAGFPPLSEQSAIAAFLDCEIAKIDALVAKKERLIALLQEKRAALISHAVTKGLDPTVPLKASGIAWLGEIPAHWAVKRLKYVATVQAGVTLGKDYGRRETTTRPYLRVANVQDGYLDLETITDIAIPPDEARRHELRPGDVLMTEGGDFDKLGRGYVWEGQIPGCLHQNHIFAVRPMPTMLNSHYLAALMTSFHGKSYFTSTSQQTTNLATTNRTKLSSFLLPLPPLAEQISILAHLDRETETLNGLIGTVREVIDRLQEYSTALISAAVTGKIDVRERAP